MFVKNFSFDLHFVFLSLLNRSKLKKLFVTLHTIQMIP